MWLTVLTQAIREACESDSKEQRAALRWLTYYRQPKQIGDVLWITEATEFSFLDFFLQIIKHGTEAEKAHLKKILM